MGRKRSYPAAFRQQMVALVRPGRSANDLAKEFSLCWDVSAYFLPSNAVIALLITRRKKSLWLIAMAL